MRHDKFLKQIVSMRLCHNIFFFFLWQQTLQYVLSDGSRVIRLWLGVCCRLVSLDSEQTSCCNLWCFLSECFLLSLALLKTKTEFNLNSYYGVKKQEINANPAQVIKVYWLFKPQTSSQCTLIVTVHHSNPYNWLTLRTSHIDLLPRILTGALNVD